MRSLLVFVLFGASFLGFATTYSIELAVEKDGTFWGKALVCTSVEPGQKELLFRLYPNAFGPFLELTEAWAGGTPLPTDSVEPTVWVVYLPEESPKTLAVELQFRGRLPNELLGYGIFAQTSSTMTLSQFYPILAPWDGEWRVYPAFAFGDNVVAEVADYTVEAVLPAEFLPVGSGAENFVGTKWQISGENLREFGLVLVRDYESLCSFWQGIPLRVFFPPPLRAAAEKALRVAEEALEIYTEKLGNFPYPDLDLVIVPLASAGGVEYPRLILIAEKYAFDPESELFAEIVAHELAHQWWYGEVGADQVREPWLDEALATYTSGLYFETKGKLAEKLAEWQYRYQRAKRLNPSASVGSALWEFPSGQGYSGYVYAGGALFLHKVRELLGDPLFFSALRSFREKFRWRLAEGAELLALFSALDPQVSSLVREFFGKD
jgi:hypothetical protein